MKKLLITLCILVSVTIGYAQVEVGDNAPNFNLKNIDGTMKSLADYGNGAVVVFTCNHCPFAKAYESRIEALHKEYAGKGYPVVAINPNDAARVPQDGFEEMKARAAEKGFTFDYLHDESQKIATNFGATKTPHVYVVQKEGEQFKVKYIGGIDDSPMNADGVEQTYLEDALNNLIKGKNPDPSKTKAVGCTIKWKS